MKKYEKYKDSGIERIGKIPTSWQIKKIKYFAKISNGRDHKSVLIDEGGYPVLGTGGEFGRASEFLYDKPSVLLGRKGTIDKPMYIEEPFWTVDTLFYTQIENNVNPKYFYYACTTIPFKFYQESSAVPSMTQQNLNNIMFCAPSFIEQNNIASFLDHKTTQIDTLIEKKEQLVEKLTLKRQAIINEAVTKGLNPDVPMKDSGIEWLGEVPEHWEVVKFRHLIDILTDFTANGSFGDLAKNVTYIEEGYSRLIRLTDLRVDLLNKGVYLSEESHNYLSKSELFGGEVLLANVGAYSGLAWLMPYNVGKASLGPNMLLLKFKDQLDNKYAYHAMISKYLSSQFKLKAISAAQPKINKEDVRSCIFILPPKKEQMEINIYLDSKDLIYNSVSEKLEIQIAKLKLYRQSLISEAVTGKIDLRDWKQPSD